jgi:FMN phosphatase YigB (HAD superfamily)
VLRTGVQDRAMSEAAQRWVVFDLGETLVDETRNWGRWADHLAVPRLTFFAAFGAVIAARRPHTDVFELFRPDFRFEDEKARKAAAGLAWGFGTEDLYPDALPALHALRAAGYRLAVMANQPVEALAFMQTLPVDRVATSAGWGVAKPDPAFFARVAHELDAAPDCVAYIGDRLDNDVLPARRAGMLAVHLRRGPWGVLQSDWPEGEQAHVRLTSLDDIAAALATGWP